MVEINWSNCTLRLIPMPSYIYYTCTSKFLQFIFEGFYINLYKRKKRAMIIKTSYMNIVLNKAKAVFKTKMFIYHLKRNFS